MCKKLLDFQIVFDGNEYWQVQCCFYRKRYGCRKHPVYPPHCSHFVKKINFGVEFRVLFSKTDFPERSRAVRFVKIIYHSIKENFLDKKFVRKKKSRSNSEEDQMQGSN